MLFNVSVNSCHKKTSGTQCLSADLHSSCPGIITLEAEIVVVDAHRDVLGCDGVVNAVIHEWSVLSSVCHCNSGTAFLLPFTTDSRAWFQIAGVDSLTTSHCVEEIVHELSLSSLNCSTRWISCSSFLDGHLLTHNVNVYWCFGIIVKLTNSWCGVGGGGHISCSCASESTWWWHWHYWFFVML